MQDFWAKLSAGLEAGQQVLLVTEVGGPSAGRSGLYDKDGRKLAGENLGLDRRTGLVARAGTTLFQQWLWPRPGLVIFGGGHVAQPVAQIGALLGFRVTVCDDRREFANQGRFPGAQVLALPYEEVFQRLAINSRHYLVIVTRGHFHDRTCLVQALKTDAAYIGVIGSAKKAAATRDWLLAQNTPQERVERIHSPIGLNIGAVSPAEIAVSILAEIIRVKSQRPIAAGIEELAAALSGKPADETWGLVTVVAASGSTPQVIGARMLLKSNGETVGTVGGGPIENMALEAAKLVRETRVPRLLEYNLDNSLAAKEGMVCGGRMTVFIQPQ